MKICFMARPAYDVLSIKLSKCFSKKVESFDSVFITMNKEETSQIKQASQDAVVFEVEEFLKNNWNNCTEEKLLYFEQKYDCVPIWKYIYTDRFLIEHKYDYVVKTTVGLFLFFENIFQNNDIDYYYDETIATLLSYIGYIVGRYHHAKYIALMTARGKDATHHYILDDPYQYNCNFNRNYKNNTYSEKIISEADEYLSEFESKDLKPQNMVFTGQKPKISKGFLALPFRYLKDRLNPRYNNKYVYMYYRGYKHTIDPIKFYFKYQNSKKNYNKPDYHKNYVYYPLHYQPEASTIVCAQKYEKQLFFIDSWAKSLPSDTVLYVKEHYAFLGHRDSEFYRQLKKYPNVVLIDPWENSRKLIENSVAVTTLTGTAGWEAMLLRKPVFLGGNIFFDNAPGVIKTQEIFDKYIELIKNWKQPERQEVIHYLCEYFSTIYKGNIYATNPECLNDENIQDLVESLLNYFEKDV